MQTLNKFLKLSLLIVFVFLCTGIEAQTIRTSITSDIDSEGRYFFYIHDFSTEGQEFVDIDLYDEILTKICKSGFHVISRKHIRDNDKYAKNIANQVKTLLKEGVPAEKIAVAGIGKSATIASDVSRLVRKDDINYVLIGHSENKIAPILSENSRSLSGKVLLIKDKGSTKQDSLDQISAGKKVQSLSSVEIPLSMESNEPLYSNISEWIVPAVNWVIDGKAYSGGLAERFYSINPFLDEKVEEIFSNLTEKQRVGQMIITSAGELGKPDYIVKELVKNQLVGGVTFMRNTKEKHIQLAKELNEITASTGGTPLMFSMDAEPELLSNRIKGIAKLPTAFSFRTDSVCINVVDKINKELKEIGVHQNFAPVSDLSADNKIIKTRSFCSDADLVCSLSETFIGRTQSEGILATIKHFPGHGLVTGDTHEQSVYIDGDLQEIGVFENLVKGDVLSVMVGHLTVRNNESYDTDGLPASCSPKIVNGLLKDELGFQGLVVTDALNIMKAVNSIENAPLLASKAGNDLLLMPISEIKTIESILNEIEKDNDYKEQVYQSVKKIIRMKVCLGLM